MHGCVKCSLGPELYSSIVELCSHIAAILTTVMKAVNSQKNLELMPALARLPATRKVSMIIPV